jgi:phage portal protein BeeE
MAIFNNKVTKAAISPMPKVQAAVGYSPVGTSSNPVMNFYNYLEGQQRNQAMTLATVSRSRDLLASVIACMPLKMYSEKFNSESGEMEEIPLAPKDWLRQPDPSNTYNFLMAWTLDDLLFYGRAMWVILERDASGFPLKFRRLPMGSITTQDQTGPVFFGPSESIMFAGNEMDYRDIVQFISPIQGIIYSSTQTIATALKVEDSRYNYARSSIPSGVLRQNGGEPLSAQELGEIGAAFNQARLTSQTAVLNEFLTYEPSNATPDKMLMIESAQYSALDLARLCGVPPYLVGVATGSYAYTSSEQSRADLYIFGVKPYADCIAATLSMNNVLPRGTYVKFDTDSYLEENYAADAMPNGDETTDVSAMQIAEVIQKVYLGVGKVITSDEARAIVNLAGGDLNIPNTGVPFAMPTQVKDQTAP